MLISTLAEIYAQNALLESMKVANYERERLGLALAYDESAFIKIYAKLICLANKLRG